MENAGAEQNGPTKKNQPKNVERSQSEAQQVHAVRAKHPTNENGAIGAENGQEKQ
jgi:hypothetical protein